MVSADTNAADQWSCDILVVGAGPAGCAAAIEACNRGLDVVVVDKARFPRDKCCGDGLTTSALRHLDELGFDPAAVPSWIGVDDVVIRSPRGRVARLDLPAGQGAFAAVCRRRELDAALVDQARNNGVPILEGHELTAVSQTATSVEAEVNGIRFSARYLIAADGMWSPTRKALGLATGEYRGDWHAFRQYFSGVSEAAARDLVVWFEPDLLPGYAWSFPLGDGSANVGFGIQRGAGIEIQEMKKLWPDLLSRPHIAEFLGPDATPEAPHRAWPIPAQLGNLPLTRDRVFFVGDACAATDPMTGEGIGQALETGRLAIEAIARGDGDDPRTATRHYHRKLRRGMGRDHRMARTLSRVLARRRPTEAALGLIDTTGWTRRNFARWLFEDYPRAALLTPRRWRRRLFTGSGAYRAHGGAEASDHDGSRDDARERSVADSPS